MFSLEGKNALVTGASQGIGREIAKVFHSQGANIVISARSEDKLKNLKEELGGDNIHIITADVSKKDDIEDLAKKAESAMGQVDILVNNAGITRDMLLMRMSDDDWEKVIDINLNSCFYLTKALIRGMLKRRFGRIINMASVVGVMGQGGQANYAASKGGIIAFTKAIAAETAERGITANAIAPGFIETKMTEELNDEQKEMILSHIPMKKYGKPIDIANTALFLASDEAAYITGQTLNVNGGMLRV